MSNHHGHDATNLYKSSSGLLSIALETRINHYEADPASPFSVGRAYKKWTLRSVGDVAGPSGNGTCRITISIPDTDVQSKNLVQLQAAIQAGKRSGAGNPTVEQVEKATEASQELDAVMEAWREKYSW